jgi:uncharacterized GH25 family protein
LRSFLLAVAVAWVSSPVLAHDFWIEPSAYTPGAGELVRLKLWVGEHLGGETLPRNEVGIERFAAIRGTSEAPVLGIDGSDPAGILRPTLPGGLVIAYRSERNPVTLDPKKFADYLALEGLPQVAPGREVFSRCAKSLLAIGGTGGPTLTQPVGLTLELIPEADPYTLAPGGTLSVRLLYEGKPLAGAMVMALDATDAQSPQKIRSDGDGRATFTLPRSGAWLIKAVHMIRAPRDAGAAWESFWASLTFEIPAKAS